MRTEKQNESLLAVCERLNAYPLRKHKSHIRLLTPADLLTLDEARDRLRPTGKTLADWDEAAVFIATETALRVYSRLTPEGRAALVRDEVLGGWFCDDDAEFDDDGKCVNCDDIGCDEDGEFCSTPSHSDETPSVDDYAEDIEHCSRGGLLFVYPQ